MGSLSSLGIGLSLVFGCLFLALLAELYYVLWWKKRLNREVEDEYNSSMKELLYLFCWKKRASMSSAAVNPQEVCIAGRNASARNLHEQNEQPGSNKDLLLMPFGEESVESEIMRLHHLSGPPRFLFTIKEETKEDMESEDGRSRCGRSGKGSRTKSLSDLLVAVETPFTTPLSSPPFLTPAALTPSDYHYPNLPFLNGFNPLFESSIEGELNRWRSSPPPKFRFLRDAEEKLCRKLMEAQKIHKKSGCLREEMANNPKSCSGPSAKEEDGSFITIIINKSTENQQIQPPPSGSSQVLPLQSSPPESTIPVSRKSMFH
ncbi:hypothetical protein EJ110_NYTH43052 [Nymphaea thermarum]|nr:hypothetical protein EJ110_NYTH43052 [Nymphaea thermarum]